MPGSPGYGGEGDAGAGVGHGIRERVTPQPSLAAGSAARPRRTSTPPRGAGSPDRTNSSIPSAVVLLDPVGDLGVAADQRRTGAAAHQPDARPQVRVDLQVVAAAAVQREHPPLPLGLAARQPRLDLLDGPPGRCRRAAAAPRPTPVRAGVAGDDVQPDAEADRAALLGGELADPGRSSRRRRRAARPRSGRRRRARRRPGRRQATSRRSRSRGTGSGTRASSAPSTRRCLPAKSTRLAAPQARARCDRNSSHRS